MGHRQLIGRGADLSSRASDTALPSICAVRGENRECGAVRVPGIRYGRAATNDLAGAQRHGDDL